MSLKKLGAHFFLGLSGLELTFDEERWLSQEGAAGIVLFARNILNPAQLSELMFQINELCLKSPLAEPPLFCIDMEGGRISELKPPHFRTWPSALEFQKQNPEISLFEYGLDMGNYLRSLGFHVNFAPCLDTLTNPKNHLIADRALGVTSEQVVKLGKDLLRGFHEAQILTTAKHFPGHGDTLADSHFELPIDDRDLAELERDSFPPFVMASRMGATFFMTAHVIYPKVDLDWPATLSKIWIQDIMRKRLKITPFCLADDLDMQALRSFGNANEIAARFFNAGGDFIMYCHRKTPPFEVLDYLKSHINPSEWPRLEESQKTLSRIKLAFA